MLWLLSPATNGSSILYRKFVHPQLSKREKVWLLYFNIHLQRDNGWLGVVYRVRTIMVLRYWVLGDAIFADIGQCCYWGMLFFVVTHNMIPITQQLAPSMITIACICTHFAYPWTDVPRMLPLSQITIGLDWIKQSLKPHLTQYR